jgi:D-amino-acid dehydrogenase
VAKPDAIVVGGGAVGACCALELARHGARVTLLERGPGLELHAQLGEELGTSFERAGTLNVYAPPEGLEDGAREGERSGLRFSVLDADQTREFEPSLVGPVAGGIHYPDEGRVDPKRFVEVIGKAAAGAGVDIRTGTEVRSLDELHAETVIVAAGAWSRTLVDLPLEGGKGYHVDYERTDGDPRARPGSRRRGRSPHRFRVGSASPAHWSSPGSTLSISQPRVDAIRRGGERWFRGLAGRPVLETWAGLRPCLPDGLPAIGRLGRAVVAAMR